MPLKAPCYIALAGLKDFGRLVCALERTPMPAFSLRFNKRDVLAAQTDIINGRPVIYYAESDSKDGQYLAYRVSNGVEEVLLASSVDNPTFVYSPILKVEKFPSALARSARVEKKSGYTVIKLKDLSSLAKVAAYKTIYDEPPLPLFLFKERGGKVILGTTMSVNDNETVSYFYYVTLAEEPKEPFLRYSSQRVEQPVFSVRLDEHGYVYLKVIRLAADHPLVKTYE
ncbi:hypothetical protein Ngar_c34330 [Candidatus Nitrososphaera gargensis Ga9.2]|uniref:Uncharacterized protein n=1 Tax=Nitrososphaera gargensis (strain Ga9.2) TaxID=1237085 RepID=K0ILE0_NITGG|nr:hypothetical protein [Candidatus Nitrososphaera gargensis]AFU60348.1 hypothetical protein Ngar_c34330 [Candidatus Nitrososphaera gargensis Ga9.2]